MSPTSDRTIPTAEESFGLVQGLRGLRQAEPVDRPVVFNELFRYVQGSPGVDTTRVEQALDADPDLRRQYERLLAKLQRYGGDQLRAAASSTVRTSRKGDGFEVSWVEEGEEVYVMIEFESRLDLPHDPLTLHVYSRTGTSACRFPALHDRKSQIIVRPEDKLLRLLADGRSRVSIT